MSFIIKIIQKYPLDLLNSNVYKNLIHIELEVKLVILKSIQEEL